MPNIDLESLPIDVQTDVASMSASQLLFFVECMAGGSSPRGAVMLTLRQAPQSRTEADFMRGLEPVSKDFEKDEAFGRLMVARTRAENPNFNPAGKMLIGSLVGVGKLEDAWAPEHEAKSHIKAVCQKNNRGCEGDVKVRSHEVEFDETYRVADDLVAAKAKELRQLEPSLKPKVATEQAREMLTPVGLKRGAQGIAAPD